MRRVLVAGLALVGALGCAEVLNLDDWSNSTTAAGGAGAWPAVGGSGGDTPGGAGSGGRPPCTQDYAALVQLDGAVAHVRFEETSGTTVAGEYGLSGTIEGGVQLGSPPLPFCVPARAASFDGGNGTRINFGPVLNFDGLSSFSIETWIRPKMLVGAVLSHLSGAPADGYRLAFENGELRFLRYQNGNADPVKVDSTVVGANANHHVVGTYDGTAQIMCLYVDGVERDCNTSTKSIGPSGQLWVGTGTYQGAIDELAVYPRALTEQEILEHYVVGNGEGN